LIESKEILPERGQMRLLLDTGGKAGLPRHIRVNLREMQIVPGLNAGTLILLKARLSPPAPPILPGGYDFSRRAWFAGIGATGSALGAVKIVHAKTNRWNVDEIRQQYSDFMRNEIGGQEGALATALLVGDASRISKENMQALRTSGLAHLVSISGLHVSAVVGAIFILVSKSLSLIPWIALRIRIPLLAAGCAAAAAVAYTIFTGNALPTIRSCVAAIAVLGALALGRDPVSLRLIATGAILIMVFRPEAIAGPSFQMSFAAVTTIVALVSTDWYKHIFSPQIGAQWYKNLARHFGALFVTGLAIEIILMPIALFHFHRAGVYGALANLIAIPLTTFVVMPASVMATVFDSVGISGPFWWITGQSSNAIIWIAVKVTSFPGASMMRPSPAAFSFWLTALGLTWIAIFNGKSRMVGLVPLGLSLIMITAASRADILVTGDGRHLALVDRDGNIAMLRQRTGEYIRDSLSENAGLNSEPIGIDRWPGAICSEDSCVIEIIRGGRDWRILATRSGYRLDYMALAAACNRVDIVVSERWLPGSCQPAWLKLDRDILSKTGGMAISLSPIRITTVESEIGNRPWALAARMATANEIAKRDKTDEKTGKTVVRYQSRGAISEYFQPKKQPAF
jgi:competence protein ComEC